jgi:hypothetical protein
MTPTAFVQTPCGTTIPGFGHISFGGPELLIDVNGKTMRFEMHSYFGPQPVTANGNEMVRIPAKFWDAWERWDKGGRIVDGNVCVVPQWCSACGGSGCTGRRISSRTMVDVVTCASCKGNKVAMTETGAER